MNLFGVGWGLSAELVGRFVRELGRTGRLYPQLDHASIWHRELPGGVVVGAVQTAAAVAAPRSYVHADDRATVLYDGLPIDPSGGFPAHQADALAAHWPALTATLEGRFCVVRVGHETPEIELITDALGVEQVYVYEAGGSSLISNSAGLIQRVIGATDPDPLGVSMFLVLDAVEGDRTLRRGVHALPGAQHWSWRAGDAAWSKRRFWSWATDPGPPVRSADHEVIGEIIDGVTRFCTAAAAVNGSLNAPITGGKDSRMLAAILMAAEVPTQYWTAGDAQSLDVEIARKIAARHGLPHRVANRPTQLEDGRDPTRDVAAEWESLTSQFVAQTDGMASVFLVGNIQGQPSHVDQLAVTLTAMCAETARAADAHNYLCGPDASLGRIMAYLPYALSDTPRGLVSADAYRMARGHVRDWVQEWFENGTPLLNLPIGSYLDDRCRRWATLNPRELAQTEDKVLPFLTRAYVEPVFSTHPDERVAHRIHLGVIRALVPELEHDPPVDIPWPGPFVRPSGRRRAYNALMCRLPYGARRTVVAMRDALKPPEKERPVWSPYDEPSWLEANLASARETCLSQEHSPLWAYVSRRKLEHLLAADTPARERRVHQFPLFATLTMFQYEQLERSLRAETSPA